MDLSELRESRNVYYTGLDPRAFPFRETQRRIRASQDDHIRYLKVLCMIVDHVVVPPSFLVFGMRPADENETFVRSLVEFFQAGIIITSVHSSMSSTADFVDQKIQAGDEDERAVFLRRQDEARLLFSQLPLVHRSVESQVDTFVVRMRAYLAGLDSRVLPSSIRELLLQELETIAIRGERTLGRQAFVELLKLHGVDRHPRAYRACYYAMNAAFYLTGAETYHSDIACLAVEEYSVLGDEMFSRERQKVLVGYDPQIFHGLLMAVGVHRTEIDMLSAEGLLRLRNDGRFTEFVAAYHEFVRVTQMIGRVTSGWTRRSLAALKEQILVDAHRRFHAEQRNISRWTWWEDVGGGFILATLGAVLGFGVLGPAGAAIGAGLGFAGPAMKAVGASVAENIARKASHRQFAFYLYIEYLYELLGNLPMAASPAVPIERNQ